VTCPACVPDTDTENDTEYGEVAGPDDDDVLRVGVGWVGVGFVVLDADESGVVGSTVGVDEVTPVAETVADVGGCELTQASATHANRNSKRSPGCRSSV